jgi:hypothetical protein
MHTITKSTGGRPVFVLLVTPLPNVDATRALRWALKGLLRQCGLRCISAEERYYETGKENPNSDHA